MSRTSSEKAAQVLGNRFNLILVAAQRTREIKALRNSQSLVVESETSPLLTALEEIENGISGVEVLDRIPYKKKSNKKNSRW